MTEPDVAALAQQAECIRAMRAEGERRMKAFRERRSLPEIGSWIICILRCATGGAAIPTGGPVQVDGHGHAGRFLGVWFGQRLAFPLSYFVPAIDPPTPAAIVASGLLSELRWKQTVAGYERQRLHDNGVCKQFRSTLLRIAHDTTMTERELRDLAREVAG